MPIDQIDVSKGFLFEHDYIGWYFERLRREAPRTSPSGGRPISLSTASANL